MLSLVLMHKPLRHPGMPKGLAHQLASPSLTNIPEASDVGSITLALRTLGSFEFEGKNQKILVAKYTLCFLYYMLCTLSLAKTKSTAQQRELLKHPLSLSCSLFRTLPHPVCAPLRRPLPQQRAQGNPDGGGPHLLAPAHPLYTPEQRSHGQSDCRAGGGGRAQQAACCWHHRPR